MNSYLDIGSTALKFFNGTTKQIIHKEWDSNRELQEQIEAFSSEQNFDLNTVQISSSANGGIRITIVGYTSTLTQKAAASATSVSGCNVLQTGDNPKYMCKDLILSSDYVVIAGGTTLNMHRQLLDWFSDCITILLNLGVNERKLILCGNKKELEKFGNSYVIESMLTDRLKFNGEHISNFFKKIYLNDLVDEKKIRWLRDRYKAEIRSTPEVCHLGYNKIATGRKSLSYKQAIWLDIGGATSDIYYPRLSQSNDDGVSMSMGATGRYVLISTGFKHSASQTLTTSESKSWFSDFKEIYNLSMGNDQYFTPEKPKKEFLCCLCVIIAIIECCLKGNIDFGYQIDLKKIKSIHITGGGAYILNAKCRKALVSFINKKIGSEIDLVYDKEYFLWRAGFE